MQRLGTEAELQVDVRLIAATTVDLETLATSEFLPDLYHRIATVTLQMPALRERREDIPALVRRFQAYFERRNSIGPKLFNESALRVLSQHSWPGNIREFRNTIERALVLSDGVEIGPEHVNASASRKAVSGSLLTHAWLELPLRDVMQRVEHQWLESNLRHFRGGVKDLAARARITERSMRDKLKSHGLDHHQYHQ